MREQGQGEARAALRAEEAYASTLALRLAAGDETAWSADQQQGIVLRVCQGIFRLATGGECDAHAAAEWALGSCDDRFKPLIQAALRAGGDAVSFELISLTLEFAREAVVHELLLS